MNLSLLSHSSHPPEGADACSLLLRLRTLQGDRQRRQSRCDKSILQEIVRAVELIRRYSISHDILFAIFQSISDLFVNRSEEMRYAAFAIVNACIEHQYVRLGTLRSAFFGLVKNHHGDFAQRQRVLKLLTMDGRNLDPFALEIGDLLEQWLGESDVQHELILFILNVLKRSQNALHDDQVMNITLILCTTFEAELKAIQYDIEKCKNLVNLLHLLDYFSVLVTFGHVAIASCESSLKALCCMVNIDNNTWHIMKNLLKSNYAHQGLQGLLHLLDNPTQASESVLRGAVFFVGMSCWGSQRVFHMEFGYGTILPSLLRVLDCKKAVVIYEVILSIKRLIKIYGDNMKIEWDIIFRIFVQLHPWISLGGDTSVPKHILETFGLIEDYFIKDICQSDEEELYMILELYLPYLQEATTIKLLRKLANDTHPASHVDWLNKTKQLMDKFYITKINSIVRQEALYMLQLVLWSCRNVCEDRVIDEIVLPYLSLVYNDEDRDIRSKGIELLIEVARQLNTCKFDVLLNILQNAVIHSRFVDAQTRAASGIASLLSSTFDYLPYSRPLRMYRLLTTFIEEHPLLAVRRTCLEALLHVSTANSQHQLLWVDKQIRISRFLYCTKSYVYCGTTVPVQNALDAMLLLLEIETDHDLFLMSIDGIKMMIKNRYILIDTNVNNLAMRILYQVEHGRFGIGYSDEGSLIRPLEMIKLTGGYHKQRCASESEMDSKANYTNNTTYLIMGFRLLVLIIGYRNELSTSCIERVVHCFVVAFTNQSSSEDLLHSTSLPSQDIHFIKSTVSLTSRVIAKLQPSRSGDKTDEKEESSEIFKKTLCFRSILVQGITLLVLTVPDHITAYLDDILRVISRDCNDVGKSPSNFNSICGTLELLQSIILTIDLTPQNSSRFLSCILPCLHPKISCKRLRILAYKNMTWCLSKTKLNDRPQLCKIAYRTIKQYQEQFQCSLAASAIDFISRVTYGYQDIFPNSSQYEMAKKIRHNDQTKTWLQGNSLITISTGKIGYAEVTIRRVTGTIRWIMQLQNRLWYGHLHPMLRLRPSLPVVIPMLGNSDGECNVRHPECINDECKKINLLSPSLAPLPSYDGNGGSPSFLYEQTIPVEGNKIASNTDNTTNKITNTTINTTINTQNRSWDRGLEKKLNKSRSDNSYQSKLLCNVNNQDGDQNKNNMFHTEDDVIKNTEKNGTENIEERVNGIENKIVNSMDNNNGDNATKSICEVPSRTCIPSSTYDDRIGNDDDRVSSKMEKKNNVGVRCPVDSTSSTFDDVPTTSSLNYNTSKTGLQNVKEGENAFMSSSKEQIVPPLKVFNLDNHIPPTTYRPNHQEDPLHDPANEILSSFDFSMDHNNNPSLYQNFQGTFAFTSKDPIEFMECNASPVPIPLSPVDLNEESVKAIDPSFVYMQMFDFSNCEEPPSLVQQGDALLRAQSVLDRTPGIETHKVGVLYVGENQKREEEILGNVGGSTRYMEFLRGLGQIVALKNLVGYTGGLDACNDSDGQFGLVWRDDCLQAIFHVATMMESTSQVDDKNPNHQTSMLHRITKKKRHIGNDFVHIVYLDTDGKYDCNTIPGQFNDVHIIIQPLSPRDYRVQVKKKPKIPFFGPLQGIQIVPKDMASEMVRITAFNANIACRVYHEEMVEFVSNAQERLKQIEQIRSRLVTTDSWEWQTNDRSNEIRSL